MSVGTNENFNNLNENINNEVNNINSGGNVQQNQFDMQATQRLDFLGELRKDTENSILQLIENQQGNFAPKNDENNEVLNNQENETLNIQNSSSEISVEQNAQNEQIFANNVSIENVHENPNEIPQQFNNVNTQTTQNNGCGNVEKDDDIIVNRIKNDDSNKKENVDNIENSDVQNVNSEENLRKKEKQHAQDKKDYRLERMLFDRINKMQGKIKESLELIKKFERINAKEENLPNIVTTLHDKLTHEVIKQFRTVGIEFNMKSYLVQSVVSDLLGRFEEGITEFRDCSENLNFVREVQEDFESKVELAPTSKVKNFFARIRGMFKPERKQERLEELERERQEKKLQEANIHLLKYKFINGELEKYTIKKNITGSLIKEMLYGQGSGLTLNVKDFINEKISPEMKMLGLEGLIPELENNMFEEYRLKQENTSKEEFENLSVGEIRKNMRGPKMEVLRSKISSVVTSNGEEQEKMVV